MANDPISVYLAATSQQAILFQQMLAEIGIEAWVESALDQQLGHPDFSASPRVVVRRRDAAEAREAAVEFDRLLHLPRHEEDDEGATTMSAGEIIETWPTCPDCQAPRQAECRVCGTTADHFAPADQPSEATEPLWYCAGCDDIAELRLFRHCHRCDHDFGEGYVPPAVEPDEEVDNRRAWFVLFALVIGASLLMGYFTWLFRR